MNDDSYNNENQVDSQEENYYHYNSGSDQHDYSAANYYPHITPRRKRHASKFILRFIAGICVLGLCFGSGYAVHYFSSRTENINYGGHGKSNGVNNTQYYQTTQDVSGITTQGNNARNFIKVTSDEEGLNTNEYSIVEVAEMTANAVVEISTEYRTTGSIFHEYVSKGAGSGVVITSDGYIVTNNHVIENASNITVKFNDDGNLYEAKLIGTDAKTDLAVIKVERHGLKSAVFGNSDKLKVGEGVVAIGNPLGSLGGTVTNGILSALDREITIDNETMNLLQTNAAINPGNSGGGLFNMSGELIGVVNAKSSGTDIEGLGFAIPSNMAKHITEDLINYGYVRGRISLGMMLIDINSNQMAYKYNVPRPGLYVSRVDASGSAKNAGILSGDCIISAAGTQISNFAEFMKIVDGHKIGDKLDIVVYRNNQQITLNMTFEEYKP